MIDDLRSDGLRCPSAVPAAPPALRRGRVKKPAGHTRAQAMLVLLARSVLAGSAALTLAGPAVAAPDTTALRTLNALRAPGGACGGPQGVAALAARPALDAATARIAGGAPIEEALRAAGYRATRAQLLRVSGADEQAQLAPLLAQRFCAQIGAAALSELGVHRVGAQTWMLLAAPFAPQLPADAGQLAQRMVSLVNQARAAPRRCGSQDFAAAGPVAWNAALATAAAVHADDMARHDYFSHEGRDGSAPAERVQRSGYRYRRTGENIAAGQRSLDDAMAGWLKSPTHCANLMQPAYTEIGAAVAVDAASRMGIYWVQEFGTPR